MKNANSNTNSKEMKAVSTCTYRNVQIMETATGCVFFWNSKQYDHQSLSEATAAIDAIYASVEKVILIGPAQ